MDMVTIVENDDAAPTALSAMAGTGMVTISWTAPATAKPVVRYIVQVQAGSAPAAPSGDVANGGPVNGVYTLNTSATSAMFTVPGGVAYSYTVNAVFGNGDADDTWYCAKHHASSIKLILKGKERKKATSGWLFYCPQHPITPPLRGSPTRFADWVGGTQPSSHAPTIRHSRENGNPQPYGHCTYQCVGEGLRALPQPSFLPRPLIQSSGTPT